MVVWICVDVENSDRSGVRGISYREQDEGRGTSSYVLHLEWSRDPGDSLKAMFVFKEHCVSEIAFIR